ncbi:ABC transporter permease [Bacteroidota bacterium]
MRTVLFIIQKEFIQVFRNKTMLPIIFIVPIVQLLILVHAATFEIKRIDLFVVDYDLTTTSRGLLSKFEGSPFFNTLKFSFSIKEAEKAMEKDEVDMIIVIPHGFEHELISEKKSELQLLINAINGAAAGLTNAYATAIIGDYNKQIIPKWINIPADFKIPEINVLSSFWYNPDLNYKIYMLPGILVILVTIMGAFLTALNIVREKEMGTIEQLNVTPIKKYQLLTGKLVPFWCIAIFDLTLGLVAGRLMFDFPIVGSVGLLFGFASVYLLLAMGIGLLISTFAETQQQVMFIIFFFMLTFVLMSGIFTPEESMPLVAQKVNILNPFAYFMRAIRMITLKGSGFKDIFPEMRSLFIYAVIVLSIATYRYRKVA